MNISTFLCPFITWCLGHAQLKDSNSDCSGSEVWSWSTSDAGRAGAQGITFPLFRYSVFTEEHGNLHCRAHCSNHRDKRWSKGCPVEVRIWMFPCPGTQHKDHIRDEWERTPPAAVNSQHLCFCACVCAKGKEKVRDGRNKKWMVCICRDI